jgi:hypothetical protein
LSENKSTHFYSDIESDEEDHHDPPDCSEGNTNVSKLVLIEKTNNNDKVEEEKIVCSKKIFHHKNDANYSLDRTTKDIIGEGYISLLHAYCRDTLFKKIKILSEEHLEGNGMIIQSCLQRINYVPSMGNKQAFINACRTEIRKTINSRRNYVKREVGKLMTSK